jgi:hypothetical protein
MINVVIAGLDTDGKTVARMRARIVDAATGEALPPESGKPWLAFVRRQP